MSSITPQIVLLDDIEVTNLIHREIIKAIDPSLEVVDFINPQDALGFLKTDNLQKLLFLDLNMPGMSGFEVLEELKNQGITIPVIILTSSLSSLDKNQALTYDNVLDYIIKPIQIADMRKLLNAA